MKPLRILRAFYRNACAYFRYRRERYEAHSSTLPDVSLSDLPSEHDFNPFR